MPQPPQPLVSPQELARRNNEHAAGEYPAFIAGLKARIQAARIAAARTINRELVALYWDIGAGIAEKQRTLGWGEAVVERVARDLQTEFPGTRGFSAQNLRRMQQLYSTHTAPEFLSQAVRESGGKVDPGKLSQTVREWVTAVPWGHHANVLARVTTPAAQRLEF